MTFNNKNTNKTFKTLLLLSIVSIMLIPGGIIPVHAAPGDLLLTINNPIPGVSDNFGYSVATTINGDLLIAAPFDDTGALQTQDLHISLMVLLVV